MTAVQGYVLHVFVVDDLPHAVRGGVEDHRIGGDLDSHRGFSNSQLDISSHRSGDGKIEVGDQRLLEARSRHFDVVDANRQGGD